MSTALALRPLGRTGIQVSPIGLAASYRPGPHAVQAAAEAGVNLFFGFGLDSHFVRGLREVLPSRRTELVVVTGAYNYIWRAQDVRKTFEKRLRQLRTDYIDVFLFLGVMKPEQFTPRAQEQLRQLREEGKVRAVGISCHNREFLGALAHSGAIDTLMLRYNAAHRGAETDIFPHLEAHRPGVIGYTATRWSFLLRRPRGWPTGGRVPTAGECYRFVLTNPNVHTVLTAPKNERELQENLAAVQAGPLSDEDMAFMRAFGDAVHQQRRWFM